MRASSTVFVKASSLVNLDFAGIVNVQVLSRERELGMPRRQRNESGRSATHEITIATKISTNCRNEGRDLKKKTL